MVNSTELQRKSSHDREIISIVRSFATSDASKQGTAWTALRAYHRDEIIGELRRLQNDETISEADRIAIAFALCNMDFDYSVHRQLIVTGLETEPHYKNPLADWEAGLIGRLIDRGDKDLLPVLFRASQWSDGAMAEDLSNIFEQELVKNPESFVVQLTNVPSGVRKSVYRLIEYKRLPTKDVEKLKSYLSSALSDSGKGHIARELLMKLGQLNLLGSQFLKHKHQLAGDGSVGHAADDL